MRTWNKEEKIPHTQALADAYELREWIRELSGQKRGRYPGVKIRRIIEFLEYEAGNAP